MKEFEELKPFLLKKRELRHLSSIIYYDMQTRAPIDGLEDEADIWGGIDTQYNEIIKSPEYIKAVKDFAFAPGKDLQLQRLADLLLREVEDTERLTLKQLEEWNKAISESNSAWRQAKKTNDFQSWLCAIAVPAISSADAAKVNSLLFFISVYKIGYDTYLYSHKYHKYNQIDF